MNVITELKNTDLHALSAQEALVDMMGVTAVVSLRRYTIWSLSGVLEITSDDIDQIFQRTYAMMNINKEKYRIGDLPPVEQKPGYHVFRVTVAPLIHPDLSETILSIAKKTNIKLATVKKTKLWEIRLQGAQTRAEIWTDLGPKIIELLANPLTEKVQLCP